MTKTERALARGKRTSVRRKSRHPRPLPTARKSERGRGEDKRKGGPVPGTPSPKRTRMSAELQAHVRRLYEESDQPICQIALDVGVDESVIRRMGPREGWVRFVAPPRDLPPVAKLLAQVEEMEKALARPPNPDSSPPRAALVGGGEKDNIARFTQVVMAHLDEFEAMRRDGRLLPAHHLATARAISILTEAFNRLARLRAALPGTIDDDSVSADMPADLDAFREELAQRIEKFIASRTDPGAFAEPAAAPAERVR